MKLGRIALLGAIATLGMTGASALLAHGDVTPQAVDTSALPEIGEAWLEKNPYSGNAKAIEIGQSAYGQNCARCHGLDAESGGIAPDLRERMARVDEDHPEFRRKKRQGQVRSRGDGDDPWKESEPPGVAHELVVRPGAVPVDQKSMIDLLGQRAFHVERVHGKHAGVRSRFSARAG